MKRPIIKYFGSKWKLAKRYPVPKHSQIIEPFAGGAAYSLHHARPGVILIEKDESVVSIWRYLLTAGKAEILDLPCEELAPGQDLLALGLPIGAANLITRWQRVGRNDCATVSKWNNTNTGLWHPSTRAYIAEASILLQGLDWSVMHGTYRDAPDVEATWFIDPPYANPNLRGCYQCDSRGIDYSDLTDFCRSRQGQVIVCEGEGANWLPFEKLCENTGFGHASLGKKRKVSTEMIWTR